MQCFKCGTEAATKTRAHENPIVDAYPQIMDWWDCDENTHQVEDISHRSRYEASFICPQCIAKFKRPVSSFITVHRDGSYRPVGCPECGYCPRENPEDNLKVLCPEITEWWNYEKNVPNRPEDYTLYGAASVYLNCPDCGAEFYRRLGDSFSLKDGVPKLLECTYCADRKALPGYNTFDVRQPDLMKEWLMAENVLLGISPDEILETSTEKVWWRCLECDYKYLLTPRKRVLKKRRGHNPCPRCKGHRWLQVHFV